ncbi:hypothetical protein JYK22_21650, partial [Nonomuraea sp. RK-328]|nr:hypothetical protein [Nonomuraea sp. RK-328]
MTAPVLRPCCQQAALDGIPLETHARTCIVCLRAQVDAVLSLHEPQRTYALAQDQNGRVLCGHDPDSADYEGTHEEGEDGELLCVAQPGPLVCRHCCDCEDGCGGHPESPCATLQALSEALAPAVQDAPTPRTETHDDDQS